MLRSVALAALLGASSVLAVKCSLDSKCPQDSPCCSQYGECGVGAYCLGGCDPRMSFSVDACVPAPVCKDKSMTFTDTKSIIDINKYLGDPSKADWVAQGEPLTYNGNVLLTMPKDSVGTVLASTEYMWYGNVKAKFKTGRGRGVVTAFILLSDVKDEIDYEFVGVDLQTAQTNYYFQGIPNYHNSGNISSISDSFSNYHEYEIQWTPDQIKWLIDGQVGRTVNRKDTWNATANRWEYPQTPARVQLSIWPGGAPSNAKGTIDWAGGVIDWDSDDIKKAGYYYATFQSVDIQCYKTTSPPGTNSGKSYTYSGAGGTNDTVINGNKDTIIASFEATGLDPEAGKQEESSASSSAAAPKKTQAQIPGGGNGASGNDHSSDSGNNKGSGGGNSVPGGSSGSSGSNGGGSSGGDSNCDSSSFNQNCGSNGNNGGGKKNAGSRTGASALAVVIAGVALYLL
ncbi:putative glycosidase crf2 [Cladobotryum mycophilum]|uniref:Crh-like protein n=1 Tax=Cladobotryum mycophilum TaxID=491253 RepID=A0ABR0SQM8_9HYPO